MNGKSKIETADTRNHRALSVEDRDGVPTMCRTPCRAFRTVANHEPFWARFVAVGLEIIDMVSFCEPRKNRKLGYKHKGTGIPKRMVRKLIFDWAITIGVHPWALGFTAQEGGLVKLPRYVVITCTLRPNVFLDETEKRTLQGPESIIPSRIITLTVSSKPKIRAVVISEHRSLDFELAAVCRHFEDIIFVLTGGYPSIAVREFVHLVSINLALANVPFYYFNDHDIYGFQQFKGWKYGFGATAWASPSLICSQLEWGGPSVAAVEATIKPYSQEVMASRQAADPQLTSQVAETQRVQWELKTLNRFRRKMQQAGASEEARRRVVSMKRTGLIGTEEEGVVDEEIEKMMSSHQVCYIQCINPQPIDLLPGIPYDGTVEYSSKRCRTLHCGAP